MPEGNSVWLVRREAQDMYANDEVEIRDDAPVSWSDDGAWVQAWVYVPKES